MEKTLKISLFVIVLLAIPVSVYLVSRAGPIRFGSKAGGFEKVMLFVMPAKLNMDKGELIDFAVKIDTGKEAVSGGRILINFDPLFLNLDGEVKAGFAFEDLTSQIKRGQVVLDCQGDILGQGTVAVLSFKAVGRGETAIEIDKSSVIWDEGGKTNILGKRVGAEVTIQ